FLAVLPKAETGGAIEITQQRVEVGIPFDQVHNLRVVYDLDGVMASSADVYLNGDLIGTIEGFGPSGDLSMDMSLGTILEVRSQRSSSLVDNIALVGSPHGVFYGYEKIEGWVDTGSWMGW